LGGGWSYLHHRHALSAKTESIKSGPSGLGNRVLWFTLKLQITLQLDQAQTVWVSQGMARWSSSPKYSCVHASTLKCDNTFWRLHWEINFLRPWLIMGWGPTTTTISCHPSTTTQRYDTQIICPLLKRIIPIIDDHIINSHHSTCQCMDKRIRIQVCFLVCYGLGIVLGCTMMSLYIMLGLFQSHIPLISLHGRIKIDYCIEAKNK
jgi:hypothetical protein